MCDPAVLRWFANLARNSPDEFNGKTIIEVGSKGFNGSVRPIVTLFGKPSSYIGVDVSSGKYVDMVVPAEKLVKKFGENSFDVVISTEMLEHVFDWKIVMDNLKKILKTNGMIFITTRSFGFPYHGYPFDYWRYEVEDMKRIFADFEIQYLHNDTETVGVWLKAKKPANWQPRELYVELYSMAIGKKTALPAQISYSRRILLLLHQFLLRTNLQKAVPSKSNINQTSRALEDPFIKKVRLLLLKSGLFL